MSVDGNGIRTGLTWADFAFFVAARRRRLRRSTA
jgi:hypothetical protein